MDRGTYVCWHCGLRVLPFVCTFRIRLINWWWSNARAQMQSVYLCIHFARFSIYYIIISIIISFNRGRRFHSERCISFRFEMHIFIIFVLFFLQLQIFIILFMVICTNRIGLMEHENKEKKFQNKQKRKQKQIGKWEINKAKLMPQRAQARERKCCSKDREKKIEPKFSVYYRESDSMKKWEGAGVREK